MVRVVLPHQEELLHRRGCQSQPLIVAQVRKDQQEAADVQLWSLHVLTFSSFSATRTRIRQSTRDSPATS